MDAYGLQRTQWGAALWRTLLQRCEEAAVNPSLHWCLRSSPPHSWCSFGAMLCITTLTSFAKQWEFLYPFTQTFYPFCHALDLFLSPLVLPFLVLLFHFSVMYFLSAIISTETNSVLALFCFSFTHLHLMGGLFYSCSAVLIQITNLHLYQKWCRRNLIWSTDADTLQ